MCEAASWHKVGFPIFGAMKALSKKKKTAEHEVLESGLETQLVFGSVLLLI